MRIIDERLQNSSSIICQNIDKLNADRGLLSQNVLSQLRTLVEHVALKIYDDEIAQVARISYEENITKAVAYIKTKGQYVWISKFHNYLQASKSHYVTDHDSAERLMLKYFEHLLKLRSFMFKKYTVRILENLERFPLKTNKQTEEYYVRIATKLNPKMLTSEPPSNRYYIHKKKPVITAEGVVFYELTVSPALGNVSKFDRAIVFTKYDVKDNYAVKLWTVNESINVFGQKMPIKIATNWQVSIRPCEFDNFIKIFGINVKVNSSKEYMNINSYLTSSGFDLVDIVNLPQKDYEEIKDIVVKGTKVAHIFNCLDECREIIINVKSGSNILRYLLYTMNNKIIKLQYQRDSTNEHLSKLNFDWGCIPFERMPFCTSLKGHNPSIYNLIECISTKGREHELLSRKVKTNTENYAQMYTQVAELGEGKAVETLISTHNEQLYSKHKNRQLKMEIGSVFVSEYEETAKIIIEKLLSYTADGIKGYGNSVEYWLENYYIDCEHKKQIIQEMFNDSKLAMIYGSAGTGKSTLVRHISNFIGDKKKLFLAHTNPAVDNLKRKVGINSGNFMTITQFLRNSTDRNYDLVVIDECSTVSNKSMCKILNVVDCGLLVLVGDIHQIESIEFGNWFTLAQYFIPNKSRHELVKPYRTTESSLLEFWDKVRNNDEKIVEHITKHKLSKTLDETIFTPTKGDEIILCLNYDGLYGINNINRLLQASNGAKSVDIGIWTYKVGDKILFTESRRYAPVLYNNLKGVILDIEEDPNNVRFTVEIDRVINEMDTEDFLTLKFISSTAKKSTVSFSVSKHQDSDEDDSESNNTVPFQIAYAVSIHKAQGLEYDSVKVIITDEVDERISHNIFYTAITRARQNLQIYWSPETENKVLSNLSNIADKKDAYILARKFNLKVYSE